MTASPWPTAKDLLAAMGRVMEDECPWCEREWVLLDGSDQAYLLEHEPDCELGQLLVLASVPDHLVEERPEFSADAPAFTPSRTGDT